MLFKPIFKVFKLLVGSRREISKIKKQKTGRDGD